MGEAPSYPHMLWAHGNGYSKKYASSGWAHYERPFLRWAAGQGYRIDLATREATRPATTFSPVQGVEKKPWGSGK